jgi:hypothetical protein
MDNKQCFLCGSKRNLTREHIPPKGLFPQPRPSNLITVPCCAECNHANHQADECFRIFVSGAFNRNKEGEHIWENKVLARTIRNGRQRPFVRKMIRSMIPTGRQTPFGIIDAAFVTVPQAEIKPTVIRIAKGLLFRHFSEVPRNDLRFDVLQIDQLRLNEIIPVITMPLRYAERGKGVFRYWGDVVPHAPDAGMWVLLFYDAVAFAIFHKHKLRMNNTDDYNQLVQSCNEGQRL